MQNKQLSEQEHELLSLIAVKNHTTPGKVYEEMQNALDSVWYGKSDTDEMKRLRSFFEGKKPTVMEFVEYLVGMTVAPFES